MQLKISNLTKSFGDEIVLDALEQTFEKGKIYGLLGRNGSGKTTLFNCISQEIEYDHGTITYDSKPVIDQDIGYVYSTPMLPEFLTGHEFLSFFIDIHKDRGLARYNIHEYFDMVQLHHDDQHKLIKDYSFGMRNKLQMLCIMLLKPDILLLDEPLTAIDVVASVEMKKLLVSMKENCIMIVSTHILQIAQDICDDIVILHHGKTTLLDNDKFHSDDFEEEILEMLS